MVLLFVGTAVYDGSIKVPGFDYTTPLPVTVNDTPTTAFNPALASPALHRSPLINRSLLPQRDLNNQFGGGPLLNGSNGHSYGTIESQPLIYSSHQQQQNRKK